MLKRPPEHPAAFLTPGPSAYFTKMPPLVRLMLIAPADAAETFGVNIFRLTAAFAHLAAEWVNALADIRVANFAVGHEDRNGGFD